MAVFRMGTGRMTWHIIGGSLTPKIGARGTAPDKYYWTNWRRMADVHLVDEAWCGSRRGRPMAH